MYDWDDTPDHEDPTENRPADKPLTDEELAAIADELNIVITRLPEVED